MKLALKILRKLLKIVLIITIIVIGIPIVVITLNMTINSIALSVFAGQLDKTLPPSSALLEKQTLCGRMQGTGDGMEFLAVALIESPMSLEELKEYYKSVHFEYAKPQSRTKEERDFGYKVHNTISNAFNNNYTSDYCAKEREIYLLFNLNIEDKRNLYYIEIYDEAYWAWFDIRGS